MAEPLGGVRGGAPEKGQTGLLGRFTFALGNVKGLVVYVQHRKELPGQRVQPIGSDDLVPARRGFLRGGIEELALGVQHVKQAALPKVELRQISIPRLRVVNDRL